MFSSLPCIFIPAPAKFMYAYMQFFSPEKKVIFIMTQLRDIGFLYTLPDFTQESLIIQDHTMQWAGEWQRLFPPNNKICSSCTVQERNSLPPLPGLGTVFLESSSEGFYVWQNCITLVKFREMPSFTKQSPASLLLQTQETWQAVFLMVLSLKPL